MSPDHQDRRSNAVASEKPAQTDKLVTGGARPLLPHLFAAIRKATEIEFAVAFVKTTGLRLLLEDLRLALVERGARVRILTSDYLDITDPEALRMLTLLQQEGADVRVYRCAGSSFHVKAYLFARTGQGGIEKGEAFIGSSNISRQALEDGIEWNYRIDYPDDDGYLEARSRFEELFRDPHAEMLTDAWIDRYAARRRPPVRAVEAGSEEWEEAPVPTVVQSRALLALRESREAGYRRGLVVMATGLGKTWLSAFDAVQFGARRVLFVAHRGEILQQAAETFLRIRRQSAVGFYTGQRRDREVDLLCGSVQTLGRSGHLSTFDPEHFDYIVVDEFHHASAGNYRRLLGYFRPQFLLGLTATPHRTDQSDILSLCDDNLVFSCDLFAGIKERLLSPFHYYGIFDESVDYEEIPWRSGRFDPEELSGKLATVNRARHAFEEWTGKAQRRTLAFCVSIRHADFMAEQFRSFGVRAAAAHGSSELSRGEALTLLRDGGLQVLFSVDLFNEGVDLPLIDTVMMLRPTESKVLFLQQLGRGLRRAEGKERLVVLDFLGNHRAFLHKPQALFGVGPSYRELAEFARIAAQGRLELPEGCFANYALELVKFLQQLGETGAEREYQALRESLGRRPTLVEYYRSGVKIEKVRQLAGSWFAFVEKQGDLDVPIPEAQLEFLADLERTAMTLRYKMVLLEAFQELDGWQAAPRLEDLAERSWEVLMRRRPLLTDLPEKWREMSGNAPNGWASYWRSNPVNAWTGGNGGAGRVWFRVENGRLMPAFAVAEGERERFAGLVQEVVDHRLAQYQARRETQVPEDNVVPIASGTKAGVELPYFRSLQIACGHFREGRIGDAEWRVVDGRRYGGLRRDRHFLARAKGNSMDGGKQPVRDGDYLLLERVTPSAAGPITGAVIVVERMGEAGDPEYLLRRVVKSAEGEYILRANNAAYGDMAVTGEYRPLARLKAVIGVEEMEGEG